MPNCSRRRHTYSKWGSSQDIHSSLQHPIVYSVTHRRNLWRRMRKWHGIYYYTITPIRLVTHIHMYIQRGSHYLYYLFHHSICANTRSWQYLYSLYIPDSRFHFLMSMSICSTCKEIYTKALMNTICCLHLLLYGTFIFPHWIQPYVYTAWYCMILTVIHQFRAVTRRTSCPPPPSVQSATYR
jgi:hypothetical protein